MLLAIIRIAPLAGPAGVDPQAVHDLVWRHRAAADRLELLHVRGNATGLHLAGFLLAPSAAAAYDSLRRLVERSLTAAPELRLWRVVYPYTRAGPADRS
ncbi:hypothetical protein Cs7R123_75010 [Catellatospora sp. TT07R-123]|uniref:hypothetical protein n=1 Tax=Catellatospora sp. TT07R-123 TaxID=2733863 RepID=UPI001B1E4871|nr:hypothetical protein [Catellatospora sp. TT07R-123]GHJ50159.1 hypothetical protein Cs7R123_75010 [Catellatospora sp. TT07R-123]